MISTRLFLARPAAAGDRVAAPWSADDKGLLTTMNPAGCEQGSWPVSNHDPRMAAGDYYERSRLLQRISHRPLRPTHQGQNSQNKKEKAQSAAGEIAPAAAVGPDRK